MIKQLSISLTATCVFMAGPVAAHAQQSIEIEPSNTSFIKATEAEPESRIVIAKELSGPFLDLDFKETKKIILLDRIVVEQNQKFISINTSINESNESDEINFIIESIEEGIKTDVNFLREEQKTELIAAAITKNQNIIEKEKEAAKIAEAARVEAQSVQTLGYVSTGGTKEDWMIAAGIPESDWWAVDFIVRRESTWNPNAVNPSSGACGLAQQLPCGKWDSFGAWNDPVAALRAQYAYVNARYGGYSGAYNFWIVNHWY